MFEILFGGAAVELFAIFSPDVLIVLPSLCCLDACFLLRGARLGTNLSYCLVGARGEHLTELGTPLDWNRNNYMTLTYPDKMTGKV